MASFDPTADSAILWTRVRPGGPRRVHWSVAPATDLAPSATGEVEVPADADGCVAVTVDGLLPATNYRYWFEAEGHRSPVGRTSTLPADGTGRFRMAVVCCADWSQGYFGAYRAVAEADVDLVLHVGDYIYETEGRGKARATEPDKTVSSVDDYRARFAQTRSDADLQALHLRHPMVAIWDDHDIADNAWRHGAKAHDDAEHGPWEERLLAAATAWREYLPYRSRAPEDPLVLWRSLADRRPGRGGGARHPHRRARRARRPRRLPRLDDPKRTILGEPQETWADERIRDTTRPWCFVISRSWSTAWSCRSRARPRSPTAPPAATRVVDGKAICTDEWDGYPAARDRLVEAMAGRGRGTVLLSGDVHSAWAFEGPCAPDGGPVAVEFTAPCVTSTPMARQLPKGWRRLAAGIADKLPEARWFELERHGFVILDVEADHVRADWFSIDIEDPAALPDPAASWRHDLATPGRLTSLDDGPLRPEAPADEVAVPIPARPPGVGKPARRRRRRRVALVAAGVAAGVLAGRGLQQRRARR